MSNTKTAADAAQRMPPRKTGKKLTAQEVELFNGRLDAAKLRALLPVTVDVAAVDHWWLCGPFGLVEDAIGVLTALGVPRGRIHRELFYVEDTPPAQATHAEATAGPGAEVLKV